MKTELRFMPDKRALTSAVPGLKVDSYAEKNRTRARPSRHPG